MEMSSTFVGHTEIDNNVTLYEILFKDECFEDILFDIDSVPIEMNMNQSKTFPKSNQLAHSFRMLGNEQFDAKNFSKALVYYNLAISAAPKLDPFDPIDTEPELAIAYSNRALTFNSLKHIDNAIKDCHRAIMYTENVTQKKKYILRKLSILTQTSTQSYIEQAKHTLIKLRDDFNLNETEMKLSTTFEELIEKKQQLRQLNTINIDSMNEQKILKSLRLPLMMQKDQQFINDWKEPLLSYLYLKRDKLSIDESKSFGIKVRSSKPIDQLELLSIERLPLVVIANNQYSTDYCASCLRSLSMVASVPCRGCNQLLFYCGETCEDNAFHKYHQYECGPFWESWNQLSFSGKFLIRCIQNVYGLDRFVTLFQNALAKCAFNRKFTFNIDSIRTDQNWFVIFCNWIMQLKISMKFFNRNNLNSFVEKAKIIYMIVKQDYQTHTTRDCLQALVQFLILFENLFPLIVQPIIVEPTYNTGKLYDISILNSLLENYPENHSKELWWRDFNQKLNEQLSSNMKCSQTIGFGLYPGHSILLKQCNSNANVKYVYCGSVQGVRTLKAIDTNQTLHVKLNQLSLENVDSLIQCRDAKSISEIDINRISMHQQFENVFNELDSIHLTTSQLETVQKMLDSERISNYESIQLTLFDALMRHHCGQSKFTDVLSLNDKCLRLLSDRIESDLYSRLYTHYLIRQAKAEFQLFTERDIPVTDSVTIATRCLIHCSNVINRIYQNMLPLTIIISKFNYITSIKRNAFQLENIKAFDWTTKDNLHVLTELEDMLVSCDMFTKQFEQKNSIAN